jgi:hypothetical protein
MYQYLLFLSVPTTSWENRTFPSVSWEWRKLSSYIFRVIVSHFMYSPPCVQSQFCQRSGRSFMYVTLTELSAHRVNHPLRERQLAYVHIVYEVSSLTPWIQSLCHLLKLSSLFFSFSSSLDFAPFSTLETSSPIRLHSYDKRELKIKCKEQNFVRRFSFLLTLKKHWHNGNRLKVESDRKRIPF